MAPNSASGKSGKFACRIQGQTSADAAEQVAFHLLGLRHQCGDAPAQQMHAAGAASEKHRIDILCAHPSIGQ